MCRCLNIRYCENILSVIFIIKMLCENANYVNWFVVDNLDRIIS